MGFQPLNKKVLVKRIEEEAKTASGIIIPDSAKEKPSIGTVEAVAKDVEDIKVGDSVVFSKYGGTDLPLNDEDFLVLDHENILGILN